MQKTMDANLENAVLTWKSIQRKSSKSAGGVLSRAAQWRDTLVDGERLTGHHHLHLSLLGRTVPLLFQSDDGQSAVRTTFTLLFWTDPNEAEQRPNFLFLSFQI